MKIDKKVVNIYPSYPITSVNPPIRGAALNATKKVEDIKKCIISRAKVEEILKDGSIILLNLINYDQDNNLKTESVVESKHISNIPKSKVKIENKEKESTIDISKVKFVTEEVVEDDNETATEVASEVAEEKVIETESATEPTEVVEDAPEVTEDIEAQEEVKKPDYYYTMTPAKQRKWDIRHGYVTSANNEETKEDTESVSEDNSES